MLSFSRNTFSLHDADISYIKSLITSREIKILTMVRHGYDDCEIARQLSVSEPSINRYIANMFFKFGVTHRLEMALFAIHYNLVSDNWNEL